MNKKLLLLGFKPYLGSILFSLKDTPFLNENQIDIIFATKDRRKFLIDIFKKINKISIKRLILWIRVEMELLMFRKKMNLF